MALDIGRQISSRRLGRRRNAQSYAVRHTRLEKYRNPLPVMVKLLRSSILELTPELVAEVDRLLDQHTGGQIAAIRNQRGLKP